MPTAPFGMHCRPFLPASDTHYEQGHRKYLVTLKHRCQSNQWVGYVLHLDGIRCYFAGDTDATRECAAVQCELAVVPVGGEFTMNVEEAVALVREMCPAIVIPVHYGSIVGDSEAGRRFAKGVESFTRVLLKLDK